MTLVTGTIRDPAGNPYTNALMIASFVGQNTTPGAGPYVTGGVPQGQFETVVPGQTDSFGAFSMPLAGNDTITPTPSQWKFTVVSSTTPPVSFSVLITITGASQDISAALQAAAAPLNPAVSLSSITVTGTSSLRGGGTFGGLWSKFDPTTNSILQLEDLGTRNNQLIGFGVEQFVQPTSSVGYLNFGSVTELLIPTANSQTFTGAQTGVYGDFINFGSGNFTAGVGYGGNFESFNAGPATVLLIAGVNATANNGGVASGTPLPVQTPTNNGNATNLRAFDGIVKNISSGTVTNGVVFYAEAPINSGGGTFTNAYGLFVADMIAATNNFAIKTGVGKVSIGDASTFASTVQVAGTMAMGTTPVTGTGFLIFQPTGLAGATQTGLQSAIQTTSASTAEGTGISARADTAAAAYTQALNTGVHVGTPTVGAGSTITQWNGIRIEKAPTAGTAHSLVMAGSTSGTASIDPPATGGVANILPSTAGVLGVIVASGTSTLTANAALGGATAQTAITTAASGALTSDAIEWCYASAPGTGDSLCIVSAYVTASNVNFVRANPTAANQNVSAIVINWRVIR